MKHSGAIKMFKNDKGFGFIGRPDQPDLFIHISALRGAGSRELFAGDLVSFEIEAGPDGRPRAANVRVQLRGEQNQFASQRHD